MKKNKEILHMAVLGVWHVHTEKFLKRLAKPQYSGKIVWTAVWDTDRERGSLVAKKLRCPFVDDYRNILKDKDLDAVIIESETYLHMKLIIAALEEGKHVFSDKIICMNEQEGRKLLDVKKSHPELVYVVSHESLGNPIFSQAKSIVENGQIGKPVSLYFRRAHGRAKDGSLRKDWLLPEIAGGGALIDLGLHGITLADWLVGRPMWINARMKSWVCKDSEDSVTLSMETENGCLVVTHADLITSIQEQYLEIIGTEGIVTARGAEGREILSLHSNLLPEMKGEMKTVATGESFEKFYYPIERFADVLLGNADPQVIAEFTMKKALEMVAIVSAAYRSAEQCGVTSQVNYDWIKN